MITPEEIISAVKEGDTDSVEEILNEQPNLLDVRAEKGISLLMLAKYYNKNKVVDLLLEKKYKFNFYEACAIGEYETVMDFVNKNRGIINTHSIDGFTPLGLAVYFRNIKIAEYLIANGADVNLVSINDFKVMPIHSAVSIKDLNLTKLLLDNDADVNAKQSGGFTPLHQAANRGDSDLLELLIKHGADVNALTDLQQTPLQIANDAGNDEAIDVLINNGGKERVE